MIITRTWLEEFIDISKIETNDICKTFNATHGWSSETLNIDENGTESNHQKQQKTNRYFLSKSGKRFRKLKEGKSIEVEANKTVIILIIIRYL